MPAQAAADAAAGTVTTRASISPAPTTSVTRQLYVYEIPLPDELGAAAAGQVGGSCILSSVSAVVLQSAAPETFAAGTGTVSPFSAAVGCRNGVAVSLDITAGTYARAGTLLTVQTTGTCANGDGVSFPCHLDMALNVDFLLPQDSTVGSWSLAGAS